MRKIVLSILAAFSISANAQHIGTLPPNADGRLYYSWDSDDFTVLHTWVGAAHESGFGARVGYSQYKGKSNQTYDNSYTYANVTAIDSTNILVGFGGEDAQVYERKQFSANSRVFQLTFVDVGENHDFQMAAGVRKTEYRETTTSTRTGVGVDVEGMLTISGWNTVSANVYDIANTTVDTQSGSRDSFIANADLKLVMTDRLTIGAAIATDVVESPASIMENVRQVYTAADADYLITENLNFNVIAGVVSFIGEPDANNKRPFIRTNTTWTFLPEHGVSVNFRTRNQYDTDAGSIYYFSPERLARQSVGLNIRKPYGGLVYTAGVEYGSEQVTDAGGVKDTHPIYGWQLGVQTNPGRKTGTTYGISLIGSNAAGIGNNASGGGDNYYWYGLNSWIKVPL